MSSNVDKCCPFMIRWVVASLNNHGKNFSIMNRRIRQALTKTLIGTSVATAALFGTNAGIIFLAQPGNIQAGEKQEIVSQYGTISIALIDDLKAGGLGKLSSGTTGYVNVLSPDPVIYINGSEYENAPLRSEYIYKHELAHVLQKELIAKEAGGYPSIANPLVSFTYYYKLLKLNHDFAQVTPEADEDAILHSPFAGLERGADCFAQPVTPEDPLTYLGSSFCDTEQRYIALSLLSERWPAPLNEKEKEKSGLFPLPHSSTGASSNEDRKVDPPKPLMFEE